jgi:hypothetical protein
MAAPALVVAVDVLVRAFVHDVLHAAPAQRVLEVLLEYPGVPWSTLDYPGVPWSTLDYPSVPWSTLDYPGVPWRTYTALYSQ